MVPASPLPGRRFRCRERNLRPHKAEGDREHELQPGRLLFQRNYS